MTIGQRIADCRKQQDLSQESLGEKMGVSRQAISKWEADAALPEIDKLIGLSKLFGVTVGWLLGVEELPEEKEVLTEEQLNAMEQLIKLYAAPAPPEPEKKSTPPLVLSILALVLAAATLLTCLTHHNNLSNSLGSLSYQMMNLQGSHDSLRSQVNDLETAKTAPRTPETLHKFSFQLTPDTDEPKVTVRLTAVPKQHSNETVEFFVRKDGQEVAYAECYWDGTAYVVQQELPMENGYEYWLTISDLQGNQQSIPLEDEQAENLAKSFQLTCEIRDPGYLIYENSELVLRDFEVYLALPQDIQSAQYLWNSIDVLLIRNGEEVGRNALLPESELEVFRRSAIFEFSNAYLAFPDMKPENGDGLEIWVQAALSNGMECLEMVSSWGYEDGVFYGGELAERVTQD